MEETKTKEVAKQPVTVKSLFGREDVQQKFAEMLGKKAQGFIVSVLQIVNSNALLKQADPMSIYNSACIAATLDLPLNNNLGFAYIIPYNQKYQDEKGVWQTKSVAQFQIGAKGFNQLAQRSGQFQTINATDVREGEMKSIDRLSGEMQFVWIQDETERLTKKIVGYISYFKLINGFEKPFYMSVEKLSAHGKKYSKTWGKKGSKWEDDFESMCLKTVIKLNLSKNAPLSIEMQRANNTDQAVINDDKGENVTYADNIQDAEIIDMDKEYERICLMITDCKLLADLDLLQTSNPDIDVALFDKQREILTIKTKK